MITFAILVILLKIFIIYPYSKIVLTTTAILIVIGPLSFWLLEANNVLKNDNWIVQIFKSVFQSISTRTAGFNTVDIGQLHDSILFIFVY